MKRQARNPRRVAIFTVLAILVVVAPPAHAGPLVFDAAADFSLASNPNGGWSYGYQDFLGASLQLYDTATVDARGTPGLDSWTSALLGVDPNVIHNRTTADITFGTVTIPAMGLSFHPGPQGQFSIIRWTAPTAGLFDLSASFRGNDFAFPTTTDVHVLLNNSPLFSGEVLAFGPGPSFSDIISVESGDTVDFAVGFGPNGNYVGDLTGISATLSLIPEPSSLTLMGLGFLAFVSVHALSRRHSLGERRIGRSERQ